MRSPFPHSGHKTGDCRNCGERDVKIIAHYGARQEIPVCGMCDAVLWHKRIIGRLDMAKVAQARAYVQSLPYAGAR